MAWCNSAFWFHEALAEPLATVAIAKLETSIENLFGAGNPAESTSRILQALEGVFALKANDPIALGSSIKVRDFVKDVVTSRSRILHGTWSTLTEELPLGRNEVAIFARELLVSFTLMLDQYGTTASPVDKAKDFLDWMLLERAAQAAAAAASQNPGRRTGLSVTTFARWRYSRHRPGNHCAGCAPFCSSSAPARYASVIKPARSAAQQEAFRRFERRPTELAMSTSGMT